MQETKEVKHEKDGDKKKKVEVCFFDEGNNFSPKIKAIFRAQPLNPLEKLNFRVLGVMEK